MNINNYITNVSLHRNTDDSFLKGVLTEETYEYGNARAMVSLKICFLSWLYEFIGTIVTTVSPNLVVSFGLQHWVHFIDCIMVFLFIPFFHLLNDEETKGVIVERGWFQGLRQMAGFPNQIVPQNAHEN